MAARPVDIQHETVHVKWDKSRPFTCPTCGAKLEHVYNDGGRRVETIKGSLWVVTNFYRCKNENCEMHAAFSPVHESTLKRKKHGMDVWAKVIQHHFKHHIDYKTISEVMWDDWEVEISPGTVQSVCESFEIAAQPVITGKVKDRMKTVEKVVVSLDGAQPEKGRPAFWTFTDHASGSQLHGQFFETANWEKLVEVFYNIEKTYGIKIKGFISDKQKNIVKAVREFRQGSLHAFCQYHFLDHVAEPIAAKDSHLLTKLRSDIRDLSIVNAHTVQDLKPVGSDSPVRDIFAPIVEELKCAIATSGDMIKVFPGIEAYANLEHVFRGLQSCNDLEMPFRARRSYNTLVSSIEDILTRYKPLEEEIAALLMDFNLLRAALSHRHWSGARVKKSVDRWVYMLQCRLKRRGLEYKPASIKQVTATYTTQFPEAWQEWIRLVHSYEAGLYVAYDDPDFAFTNNDEENRFHRLKYRFKKWLGRGKFTLQFEKHAGNYMNLLNFDFTTKNITDVLLAMETTVVNEGRQQLHAFYATTMRTGRIREKDTGNLALFKQNLKRLTR
nr:hypothetical protein [Candidatus Sigynarchaeota archaeon]